MNIKVKPEMVMNLEVAHGKHTRTNTHQLKRLIHCHQHTQHFFFSEFGNDRHLSK